MSPAPVPASSSPRSSTAPSPTSGPVLEAREVGMVFHGRRRQRLLGPRPEIVALADVSVSVRPGEIVAVVGESGSGKTTLGRCLLGVLAPTHGTVLYRGHDVADLDRGDRQRFRNGVQAVYQASAAALNPRRTVGQSVSLPLLHGGGMAPAAARDRCLELLEQVDLAPERTHEKFPHQLSGGQRQRVGIARALALEPEVVIADEPVSALDVSVRAQVLQVIDRLARTSGVAFVFISHDLGVVSAIADRMVVMKDGRVVESGETRAVIGAPRQPYTQRLLAAVPEFQSFRT